MSFFMVCGDCRKRYPFGTASCPACGWTWQRAVGITKPRRIVAVATPKARARKAVARARDRGQAGSMNRGGRAEGCRDALWDGTITKSSMGWVMQRDGRAVVVRVEGDLSADRLEETLLQWRFKRWAGNVAHLEPIDCQAVREIRVRAQTGSNAADGVGYCARFGAKPAGTSHLERIGKPRDRVREIQRLADRKDDPEAWSALANGYRIAAIRAPLEGAMSAVGWEHFAQLLEKCPADWPDGLAEWVEGQRLKHNQRDLTASVHTYRHSDYGIADV